MSKAFCSENLNSCSHIWIPYICHSNYLLREKGQLTGENFWTSFLGLYTYFASNYIAADTYLNEIFLANFWSVIRRQTRGKFTSRVSHWLWRARLLRANCWLLYYNFCFKSTINNKGYPQLQLASTLCKQNFSCP